MHRPFLAENPPPPWPPNPPDPPNPPWPPPIRVPKKPPDMDPPNDPPKEPPTDPPNDPPPKIKDVLMLIDHVLGFMDTRIYYDNEGMATSYFISTI